MMLKFFLTVAAAANLAAALPTYNVPTAIKSILKSSFCVLPDEFVITDFQIWTPATGNNRSTIIDFDYSDQSTHLDTKCHFNETSVNVDPHGSAARYACELDWIHFIWEDATLTMIEKACPLEEHGGGSEAAGSVTPKLTCFASTKNNTVGEGKACTSSPRVMAAVFTSLEPTPK